MTVKKADYKAHWENVYQTKSPDQVSWYQPVPITSLQLLTDHNVPRNARILDVGGGDGTLVDHLLAAGYEHITVLDISKAAIGRAKKRLGSRAKKVTWLVADITQLTATEPYDFWHDRAVFHFLTRPADVDQYVQTLAHLTTPNARVVMGTFSEDGPTKCSGLPIQQYSETSLSDRLLGHFHKLKCVTVNHRTPFDTIQNFLFCSFQKRSLLSGTLP